MRNYVTLLLMVLFLLAIGTFTYTCEENKRLKRDNERLIDNASSERKSDSVGYSNQTLKIDELKEYFEYENKQLRDLIKKEGIKEKRIERITTHKIEYLNSDTIRYNLDSIKTAILNDYRAVLPISYSDSCISINGVVEYDKNKLNFNLIDKKFLNETSIIAYQDRKEWRFLFWKTKFLGKRNTKVKVFDKCGKSETKEINVIK